MQQNTLRVCSLGFEIADLLVKLFPTLVLDDLGNGQWQDIPQGVLLSIIKVIQTAYKGIFKSIILCFPKKIPPFDLTSWY